MTKTDAPMIDRRGDAVSAPIAALAAFCALAVAMGIGRFAFTPLLPLMRDDIGLSVADGGWLAAANYLGYFVGAVAAVVVAPTPARAVQGGLIVTVAATGAMGIASGFAGWIALRAAAGIASAWVFVFAATWAGDVLTRAGRRWLNGAVFAGVGGGIALAGLATLVLARMGLPSPAIWGALAAVAAALSVVVWVAMDGAVAPRPTAVASVRGLPAALRLCACYAASGIGYIIPATFLPALAKELLGDATLFQWAWPVFGIAAALSTLVAGPLARAIGNVRLWIAGHIIMAVGVVLPVLVHSFVAVMASALLVGGTFMVTTLGAIGAAHDIGGDRARTLIAAMTAAFAAGQVLGPVALSAIVASGAPGNIAWIGAALVLVASAFALVPLRPSSNVAETKR
ncbi:MAG: YbfB/YjiJ family MFS transporter [Gemmatimonas sp.]